jgi:hypothetical protein
MKERTKLIDPTLTEVEFLRCELATGLTLAKIALDASGPDKSNRNSLNARKAYDAVLRFAPRVNLSADETNEIKSKLERLKTELQLLGEQF